MKIKGPNVSMAIFASGPIRQDRYKAARADVIIKLDLLINDISEYAWPERTGAPARVWSIVPATDPRHIGDSTYVWPIINFRKGPGTVAKVPILRPTPLNPKLILTNLDDLLAGSFFAQNNRQFHAEQSSHYYAIQKLPSPRAYVHNGNACELIGWVFDFKDVHYEPTNIYLDTKKAIG
jgi:hypothetical protein